MTVEESQLSLELPGEYEDAPQEYWCAFYFRSQEEKREGSHTFSD